jgi:hypothetical protein
MTKDEIIIKLEKLNIIAVIGKEYMITEKYKELLSTSFAPLKDIPLPKQNLDYNSLLNPSTNGGDWPIQIKETSGHARATGFCDLCEIPRFANKGYPLRGMGKDAINILGNIIADKSICPSTFIDSVKTYYRYSEMPKAIKNLILEGVILEVYREHIEGKLKSSLTGESKGENSTWQN